MERGVQGGVAADDEGVGRVARRCEPGRHVFRRGQRAGRAEETQRAIALRNESAHPRAGEIRSRLRRRHDEGDFGDPGPALFEERERALPEGLEVRPRREQLHLPDVGGPAGQRVVDRLQAIGQAGRATGHQPGQGGESRLLPLAAPPGHRERVAPLQEAPGGGERVHARRRRPEAVRLSNGGHEACGALTLGRTRPGEAERGLEHLDEARRPHPVLARRGFAAAKRSRPAAEFEIRIEDDSHRQHP